MEERDVPGVHRYDAPAGGWGALPATARAVAEHMHVAESPALLLRMNKPDGFDCPGCSARKEHTSTFQFCENGPKAVTWEATKKRVHPSSSPRTRSLRCSSRAITSWRTTAASLTRWPTTRRARPTSCSNGTPPSPVSEKCYAACPRPRWRSWISPPGVK